MIRLHLHFLTVATCLACPVIYGQVSPLRLDEQSAARSDRSIAAPLLDEWVRQAPLPTARNLSGIAWATATHAFASADGLTIVETLDGGLSWTDVDLPSSSTDPLYNISCLDANTCVAIGNSATTGADIYRTSNAGVSWQRVTKFPLGGSWYHIDFVSPTVGFMGSNGATARTQDAGETWQIR